MEIKDSPVNTGLLGALEAGGTKMICAVGTADGTVIDRVSFPTGTPEETMPKMLDYFGNKDIKALGIGCFGPIDLIRDSATYGYITTTPKLAWRNFNIVKAFKDALNVPVGFDTDVNAAVLGEAAFGAAKGLNNAIYATIGTGVGIGVLSEGKLLHGILHPEGGHILIARRSDDTVKSSCPFHDNCLEGLAAGPAIEKRYGKKGFELADRPEVWELEAYYIAQALVNYTLLLAPERIVLGGGVMAQEQLFPLIRAQFKELMNGYLSVKALDDLNSFIVPSALNGNQAVLGCFMLAAKEQ
jgi:fructokinase